jgi:hypothetical protein
MIPALPLPDWIPWWGHLAILIAGLLFALMFLLMPFAVFGVKGRLELLEARLDEIQGEIRSLSLRLPEPGLGETRVLPAGRRTADPEGYASMHGYSDSDEYGGHRPPIPPAPRDRRPPAAPSRTEPRLY